ncbi:MULTISPECIES: hypothetical protein [Streptomyces]|uniref:FXSXX-COOH protein n=1 Tax=Streptomyces prasinus TaxID=67345 RepID=A0ABX6B3N2_9ACTN|nr:hypothetical protein [Streptomyces prasinus]QEV09329.1 hypothetical protein CP972_30325 [Streptomyces prasinus]
MGPARPGRAGVTDAEPGFARKKVSRITPTERQISLPGVLSETPGMRREELTGEKARFFG